MSVLPARTAIPIPARMARLPIDRRGYPVPVIVMRDGAGRPLFAANDENERQRVIASDGCQICGSRLLRGRWFVGGALSACAEHGQFMDSGMHDECAHYALKVCPYLAAPAYGRLVGPASIANSDRADVVIVEDETRFNQRPLQFFAVMAVAQELTVGTVLAGVQDTEMVRFVRPKPGSVRNVEIWQNGEPVTDSAALAAIRERLAADLAAIPDKPRPDVWARWP